MKRLVIGITAHVDSGKTTLSEALLYRAGELRRLGRVDHGDAFLDNNELEREKGITIFSKQALLRTQNAELTLLDTPGHVDFSAETERAMSVLDYAILVISGSDGVREHTETLWRLLARYGVPVFIFVNKMDIAHKTEAELMSELRARLGAECVRFEGGLIAEDDRENAAVCDERLMESYFESGGLRSGDVAAAVKSRKIFPCCFGSALRLSGVDEFLSVLEEYTVQSGASDKFAARVYKIAEDERGKRLTYMKITGGSLKVRDQLSGRSRDGGRWSEKVSALRVYSGEKFSSPEEVFPGTVCAVAGLSETYPGEGLGAEPDADAPALEPALTYKVELPPDVDAYAALTRLRRLEEEDPQLCVVWNERLREIHLRLMGGVQLEIVRRIIAERFGMEVEFGAGSVAYKETIADKVEGVGHYEPLRHYAEVHLILEPLKRGSGLRFASDCSEDALDRSWQRLILAHLREKTHIGVLTGSPITDMKITLAAGRAHKKHTEGGDFRQATYRAVRQGLKSAQSVLLEPWYEFRLEVPPENVGRAMTDIQRMGGSFSQPETGAETAVISGRAPVSEMRSYQEEVTAYTRGRGRLSCAFGGYEPCHDAQRVIEEAAYDADADTENPADSVFCAHGAGFVVKWDEVPRYMHLESALRAEDEPSPEERARLYISRAADDEELLRIFEKTYGPVKRRAYGAMRTKKDAPDRKFKAKPLPEGPEYLLVDGYNIIFAWDELKKLAETSLEAARERLINIMLNYQGYRRCELILVFDAYKVRNNRGETEKLHGISVVYTKEAETADMYIEKVTHELGKKRRVRVATSDNLEQLIILGGGAVRVSAAEFKKEVEDAEKEIRAILRKMNM